MKMKLSFAVSCTVAVILVLSQGCRAGNRCGTSFSDANGKCGTKCPGGVDAECPPRERCFADLDPCDPGETPGTPPPSSENRCGTSFSDANGKCGTKCPGGVDSECPGERCFADLEPCGSPGTPPPSSGDGSKRCGDDSAGPALSCIRAHYNCDSPCNSNADCASGSSCQGASDSCTDSTPAGTTYDAFNSEQIDNARKIIGVGKGAGFPQKGWEVALVAGMQESFFLNLGCGDQDSLGLFQQRESFDWGTPEEIQTPVLSIKAFYGVAAHTSNPGLSDIAGWENMGVGEAAQAVQRAEAGEQYTQWAGLAAEIVRKNQDAPAIP